MSEKVQRVRVDGGSDTHVMVGNKLVPFTRPTVSGSFLVHVHEVLKALIERQGNATPRGQGVR